MYVLTQVSRTMVPRADFYLDKPEHFCDTERLMIGIIVDPPNIFSDQIRAV